MAYILSLEIGGTDLRTLVANMTEPARLLSEGRSPIDLSLGTQYVVRETDAERAKEISGEFYPNVEVIAEESAERVPGQSEKDEQLARVCELARRLGFNDAKTKMLLGQWASNPAGLERKLLNELDEQPREIPVGPEDQSDNGQPKEKGGQTSGAAAANRSSCVPSDKSAPPTGGFLF